MTSNLNCMYLKKGKIVCCKTKKFQNVSVDGVVNTLQLKRPLYTTHVRVCTMHCISKIQAQGKWRSSQIISFNWSLFSFI